MTMAQPLYRYRLRFAKAGPARHIGHLDLQRTWERTLRRAGLPLAHTRGYHIRARLQFGAALPLGVLGDEELLDIWLTAPEDPAALPGRLQSVAPPGLAVHEAREVPLHGPSLPQQVESALYEVQLPLPIGDFATRLEQLLAAPSLMRERRGKRYDLRPLIEEATATPASAEQTQLRMRLASREGSTGRPDEVLRALGIDPDPLLVRRRQLVLRVQAPAPEAAAPPVT